jgi:hypothetical protein
MSTPVTPPLNEVLRASFVRPFYLSLLHGNFTDGTVPKNKDLPSQLAGAAKAISDEEIDCLLAEREWRGRLTAAWLAGLSRRSKFVAPIVGLLMASELVYAGQGYCVALGLIGNDECVGGLRSYLRKYLPLNGRFYDQHWALGALAHIEGYPPNEFLDSVLWAEANDDRALDGVRRFQEIVLYLRRHHMPLT